jgi:hypothetical protein
MINEKAFSGVSFYVDENQALTMTSDELFNLIDGPEHISVHDLQRKVERSQDSLDPERERIHQERLKAHAAFVTAAQVVIDAYGEDAPPHPQWSHRHLYYEVKKARGDIEHYYWELNRFAECGPDHVIKWAPVQQGGRPNHQQLSEYQQEVQALIDASQVRLDQCIAIMNERDLKVPEIEVPA